MTRKSEFGKGVHCHAEKVELFFKHRYWFIHRSFHWVLNFPLESLGLVNNVIKA